HTHANTHTHTHTHTPPLHIHTHTHTHYPYTYTHTHTHTHTHTQKHTYHPYTHVPKCMPKYLSFLLLFHSCHHSRFSTVSPPLSPLSLSLSLAWASWRFH